jgi:hypothetical protein
MSTENAANVGRLHNQFLKLLIDKQKSIASLKQAVDLLSENAFPEQGKEPDGMRQEIVKHLDERQRQPSKPKKLPKDLARVLNQFEKTARNAKSPKDLERPAKAALDEANKLGDTEKLSLMIYISIFTESASFWFEQLQAGPQYTTFSYHVWTDWLAMAQYDAEVAWDFYNYPPTILTRSILDQISTKIIIAEAALIGALYSWLAYQRNVFLRTAPIPAAPGPEPNPEPGPRS